MIPLYTIDTLSGHYICYKYLREKILTTFAIYTQYKSKLIKISDKNLFWGLLFEMLDPVRQKKLLKPPRS